MTPNMMSTEISCHIENQTLREIGVDITEAQTSGNLERYLEAAKEIAVLKKIPVCDCYRKWKALAENGVHTTELLSNYLNHPIRPMNWTFAYSLVETMFTLA